MRSSRCLATRSRSGQKPPGLGTSRRCLGRATGRGRLRPTGPSDCRSVSGPRTGPLGTSRATTATRCAGADRRSASDRMRGRAATKLISILGKRMSKRRTMAGRRTGGNPGGGESPSSQLWKLAVLRVDGLEGEEATRTVGRATASGAANIPSCHPMGISRLGPSAGFRSVSI